MEIKYLAIPSLAITLLLTGCSQKDINHKDSKNKQTQTNKNHKKEKSKNKTTTDNSSKDNTNKSSQQNISTNNSIENNAGESSQQNTSTEVSSNTSNNQQETQAQANARMQEESRSEHNGMSNAEYAEKLTNDAISNNNSKEYQDYLNAKKSQYAVTHLTPEQKANGAGGGGAAWNYADEDESFDQWKTRTDREKAEAGY